MGCHQTDVGLLDIPPVTFAIDQSFPVWIPQYPIKFAAVEGVQETTGLLGAGVIYPTTSSWNAHILPVLKADSKSYRPMT